MADLTSEQRRIAQTILRIGRRRGATPKEIKAAIATGLVESNLRNLPGGDADSQGWRQERASLYPNPRNLTASVNRFFDETRAVRDRYGNAGDLAAAVQRPAAQYRGRYAERGSEAEAIIRALGGGGVSSSASPSSRASGSVASATTPDPGLRQQALLSYLDNRDKPDALLGLAAGLQQAEAAQAQGYSEPGHTPAQKVPAPRSGGRAGAQRGGKGQIIGTPHSGTHTLGNWQSDNAIDVKMPNGTILTAPRDAVVEKVSGGYSGGSSRFDGYQVTLRTADGNRIFMTHLSRTHVRPGQRLRAGQALGRSGSANGVPHLHMGVERGDPHRYT